VNGPTVAVADVLPANGVDDAGIADRLAAISVIKISSLAIVTGRDADESPLPTAGSVLTIFGFPFPSRTVIFGMVAPKMG
jgi:hypothetical protein